MQILERLCAIFRLPPFCAPKIRAVKKEQKHYHLDWTLAFGKKPIKFVACKWQDSDISPGLKYLKAHFPDCESWQISAIGTKDFIGELNIRVCPAVKFLGLLV